MRSARLSLLLAAAPLAVIPAAASAQYVQPVATSDADELASEIRRLAANPQDLNALAHAGELALRLDDPTAAAAFFARAQKIDPRNARVEAGLGTLLVEEEKPGEALRRFATAQTLGADPRSFAADRGLAYDLIGEQDRAQRDYRLALHDTPNDETARRYALSLGISGKGAEAERVLEPLLRRSDRGAWRARAFILAMTGDRAGAERIATTMLPPGMAEGLQPFFDRLPSLSGADRAFAVHFGETRPTPERIADTRMVPPLPALGPDPYPPVVLAEVRQPATPAESREERRRNRKRKGAAIASATTPPPQPLPEPPAYVASGSAAMPGTVQPLGSRPPYSTAMVQPLPSRARYPVTVQQLPPTSRYPATVQPLPLRSPYVAAAQPAPAQSPYANMVPSVPSRTAPSMATVQALPSSTAAANPVAQNMPARVSPSTVVTPLPAEPVRVAALPAQGSVHETAPRRADATVASILPAAPPVTMPSPPTAVASNPISTAAAASSSASAAVGEPAPPPPVAVANAAIPTAAPATLPVANVAPATPAPLTTAPTVAAATASAPVVVTPASAPVRSASVAPHSSAGSHAAKPMPVRSEDSILASIIAGVRVPRGEAERDISPVAVSRTDQAAPAVTEKASVAALKKRGGAKTDMASSDDKPVDPKKAAADKKAAEARKLADAKKAAEAKQAADEKKAAKADPPRIWVQVAGGANEDTLPKAWAAVKAKAPDQFRGKSGWTTPLRATNRVLTGPFKSDDEARDFVNALAKAGVSAFTFSSEAGQKVTRLPAK